MEELEIRLGYFEGENFNPNISIEEWTEFKNYFNKDVKFTKIPEQNMFIRRYNGHRLICYDRKCNKFEYNIKSNCRNTDYIKDNLRIARSIETIESNIPDLQKVSFTHRRTRYSYLHLNNTFRVDITKDYIYNEHKFIYSVEFELINNINSEKELNNIRKSIIKLRENINKIVKYKLLLINEMNNLVENKKRQLNVPVNQIIKIKPNIIMSRPVNIKWEDIPFLKNYVYFPKLDGYHYFVFFYKGQKIYLNENDVIISTDNLNNDLDNSIFLGEMIKDTMYIFDSLYYKGEDLRYKHLKDRLTFATYTNLNMIEYFESPEEAIKYNKLPTDGIICVPTDEPYINKKTYKWKPPEMLTIDFYSKFYKIDNDGNHLFKLYNYDKNGNMTEFRGTQNSKFSGCVVIDSSKSSEYDDIIGEFKWKNNKFEPERIRHDKIKPNFIMVAVNIWKDIQNPVLMEDMSYINEKMIKIMCDKLRNDVKNYHILRPDYKKFIDNIIISYKNYSGNELFTKLKLILNM